MKRVEETPQPSQSKDRRYLGNSGNLMVFSDNKAASSAASEPETPQGENKK